MPAPPPNNPPPPTPPPTCGRYALTTSSAGRDPSAAFGLVALTTAGPQSATARRGRAWIIGAYVTPAARLLARAEYWGAKSLTVVTAAAYYFWASCAAADVAMARGHRAALGPLLWCSSARRSRGGSLSAHASTQPRDLRGCLLHGTPDCFNDRAGERGAFDRVVWGARRHMFGAFCASWPRARAARHWCE